MGLSSHHTLTSGQITAHPEVTTMTQELEKVPHSIVLVIAVIYCWTYLKVIDVFLNSRECVV